MTCRRRASAVLVAVVVLTGCGGTGLALGPRTVSECYRSIPTALEATHDSKARLYGVHKAKLAALRKRLPTLLDGLPADPTICAVAVEGPFRAGQVTDAPPTASGRYAVVLVDAADLRVLGSFVTDRLPRGFKGRTV